MRVVARRRGGYAHDVEIEGGHSLRIDEPAGAGGTDTGPAPTRVLAASLAGCTAVTMEMYANRKGWDLDELEVEVDVDYTDAVPTSFEVGLHMPPGLSEEQRRRLLVIAQKCPVHKVIAGATAVRVADRTEAP